MPQVLPGDERLISEVTEDETGPPAISRGACFGFIYEGQPVTLMLAISYPNILSLVRRLARNRARVWPFTW